MESCVNILCDIDDPKALKVYKKVYGVVAELSQQVCRQAKSLYPYSGLRYGTFYQISLDVGNFLSLDSTIIGP